MECSSLFMRKITPREYTRLLPRFREFYSIQPGTNSSFRLFQPENPPDLWPEPPCPVQDKSELMRLIKVYPGLAGSSSSAVRTMISLASLIRKRGSIP